VLSDGEGDGKRDGEGELVSIVPAAFNALHHVSDPAQKHSRLNYKELKKNYPFNFHQFMTAIFLISSLLICTKIVQINTKLSRSVEFLPITSTFKKH
jgi:hypothetical protein